MKAATLLLDRCARGLHISIHAAREGGDLDKKIDWTDFLEFQSTPPVKAATPRNPPARRERRISIHAAREGGDRHNVSYAASPTISIHAAREGGDLFGGVGRDAEAYFNPRRP